MKIINVAILGTGNIGTDLLVKIQRSPYLNCLIFAGRRLDSLGMKKAKELGISVSDQSINSLLEIEDELDLIFDATSAIDHISNGDLFRKMDKIVIDLTPSGLGKSIVPSVNMKELFGAKNINLITCGGQVGIPLAKAISDVHNNVKYIEVVNTIASKSAGLSTRFNIDEYIEATEEGLRAFTKCNNVKAILALNPAEPCIDMQVTVSAVVEKPNMDKLNSVFISVVSKMQNYVPGYQIVVPPTYSDGRIVIIAKVRGLGDYLKPYAGNLDVITCAAVMIAEKIAEEL